MDTGDWISSNDSNGRRYAYADTPLGRCTLKLAPAAGRALTYQATLADGRRIATAGSLEEMKIEAAHHIGRLAAADHAPAAASGVT